MSTVYQQYHQECNNIQTHQLTQTKTKCNTIINMIVKVIVIVSLIQQSTTKTTNNQDNCQSNDWLKVYSCVAGNYQQQYPNSPKVSQKFFKYLNEEKKKNADSMQFAQISYKDMMRAYQTKNLVYDPNNKFLQELEYNLFEQKYNISDYDQLPFCVVVPSYQNVQNQRYKRNIKSILQQNYTNYHVVYVDDASPDNTSDYVKKFLENHPLKHKVQVLRNQVNYGHLKNGILAARKYCKPNQFYFRLDGDDHLIGKQVLKLFNAVHQQKNQSWAIYSNSILKHFTGTPQLGLSRPFLKQVIKNNDYRYSSFRFFVQQSFYTELLLRIKDQDLRDSNGDYYKYAGDAAYIWPVLEMLGKRIHYLPQPTYYYDYATGLNEAQGKTLQNQVKSFVQIQHKPKYSVVNQLFKFQDLPKKIKQTK